MHNSVSFYARTRIEQQLSHLQDYPLTVVVAGAGYGKTTTVSQYLRHNGTEYLWISITSPDEQLFWENLCQSCQRFGKDIADELTIIGIPQNDWLISRLVCFLGNHCLSPLVVCIDDWQNIGEGSHLGRLLGAIALSEIPNLHVVLLSRSLPKIKMHALLSKNRCMVIDENDLCFTKSEIAGYLSMRGLKLAPATIAKIQDVSEGWIAAIYLFGEAIRSGESIQNRGGIDKLLDEILMENITPRQRNMLVRLSGFDSFSEDMASTALGNNDIRKLLSFMLRENAFISINDHGEYIFHSLLKDYLSRQRKDDDAQKDIYHRAGLWSMSQTNRQHSFSISYFVKGGCIEEYLDFINRNSNYQLDYYDLDAMSTLVETLPDAFATKYPIPYLKIVFYLFLSGRNGAYKQAYRLFTYMWEYFSAHEHKDKDTVLGELLVISRIFGLGQLSDGEPLQRAAILLKGHPSFILRNTDPFTFGLPLLLDSEYLQRGTLDEAVTRCQTNPYELVTDGFGRGSEALVRSEGALLRCDMEQAFIDANIAIKLGQTKNQFFIMACGYFVLMRRALFMGNEHAAKEQFIELRSLLPQAESLIGKDTRTTLVMLREATSLSECFLATSLERTNEIPIDYLNGTHNSLMMGFGVSEAYSAKAMYLAGNSIGCLSMTEQLDSIHLPVCQCARITSLLLSSLARKKLFMTEKSQEAFRQCVDEASPDHVILPFAENPDCLPFVLASLKEETEQTPFLLCVKDAILSYKNTHGQRRVTQTSRLSKREIEVLRFTADGLTRGKIATALGIKDDTVKKHQLSIYQKLGAKNKIEAINIAKSMLVI